jgi:hypothetical protein
MASRDSVSTWLLGQVELFLDLAQATAQTLAALIFRERHADFGFEFLVMRLCASAMSASSLRVFFESDQRQLPAMKT